MSGQLLQTSTWMPSAVLLEPACEDDPTPTKFITEPDPKACPAFEELLFISPFVTLLSLR